MRGRSCSCACKNEDGLLLLSPSARRKGECCFWGGNGGHGKSVSRSPFGAGN
jgi:hypothetical protein